MKEQRKLLFEINLNTLKEGTCHIKKAETGEKFAVCREGEKIKIYPVVSED